MTTTTKPINATDQVLGALAGHTLGATAVDLAEAACVGKSTAGKILSALEKRGQARRATQDKGAALWFPVTDTPAADDSPAIPAQAGPVEPPADDTPAEVVDGAITDEEVIPVDGHTPEEVAATDAGLDGDPADEMPGPATLADHPNIGQKRPIGEVGKGGLVILASGGLRAEVLDYLADHPGEHTPARVAKALGGRSGGAVQKIMAKLAAERVAELTCEKPKTYRLVSAA